MGSPSHLDAVLRALAGSLAPPLDPFAAAARAAAEKAAAAAGAGAPPPSASTSSWSPPWTRADAALQDALVACAASVCDLAPTAPRRLAPAVAAAAPHAASRAARDQALWVRAALSLGARVPAVAPGLVGAVADHLLTLDVAVRWVDIAPAAPDAEEADMASEEEEEEEDDDGDEDEEQGARRDGKAAAAATPASSSKGRGGTRRRKEREADDASIGEDIFELEGRAEHWHLGGGALRDADGELVEARDVVAPSSFASPSARGAFGRTGHFGQHGACAGFESASAGEAAAAAAPGEAPVGDAAAAAAAAAAATAAGPGGGGGAAAPPPPPLSSSSSSRPADETTELLDCLMCATLAGLGLLPVAGGGGEEEENARERSGAAAKPLAAAAAAAAADASPPPSFPLDAAWLGLTAAFEAGVLRTRRAKFVQFLLWAAAATPRSPPRGRGGGGGGSGRGAAFLRALGERVRDPRAAAGARSSSAAFFGSFAARAAFLPEGELVEELAGLARWCVAAAAKEAAARASSSSLAAAAAAAAAASPSLAVAPPPPASFSDFADAHVFPAACQALLYALAFRMADLTWPLERDARGEGRRRERRRRFGLRRRRRRRRSARLTRPRRGRSSAPLRCGAPHARPARRRLRVRACRIALRGVGRLGLAAGVGGGRRRCCCCGSCGCGCGRRGGGRGFSSGSCRRQRLRRSSRVLPPSLHRPPSSSASPRGRLLPLRPLPAAEVSPRAQAARGLHLVGQGEAQVAAAGCGREERGEEKGLRAFFRCWRSRRLC